MTACFDAETEAILDSHVDDVVGSLVRGGIPKEELAEGCVPTVRTRRIPVYITCYNVLSWARNLAEQCERLGFEPVLIDNASTYPSLLEWYRDCPYRVIRLDQNEGCYGFWQRGEHARQDSYYVVTDCDLNLTGVPADLADRLVEVFERHPEVSKVGLSLEIDDLPEAFPLQEAVRNHESQFWRENVEPGVWRADVGARFAIYHPSRDVSGRFYSALRLDRPYTARHLPWYLHRQNATDEHRYYFERVQTITHWGAQMQDFLEPVVREDRFSAPMADCPRPACWTATDVCHPECESHDFVREWVRMLQPEHCLVLAERRGELSQAVALGLRDNGHGDLTVVAANERDKATNDLLCKGCPTSVQCADPWQFVPPHDFQFVWFGSGPSSERLDTFERLRNRCNGYVLFHDCVPGSEMWEKLREYESRQEFKFIGLPTPRGLVVVEARLVRPASKGLGA